MKNKYSKNEIEEQNHFDLMAKKYDINYGYNDAFTRFKINKKALEFKKFVTNNNFRKNLFIVEFGCGTGEYTKKIAEFFPKAKILAIDISREIVDVARRKCRENKNVKFKIASAYDTRLHKSSVDVICGFYFLHHVSIKKASKEIFRILRPGGLCFFYEPNILNPIVFLIKSSKFVKKLVGDSPDESAINPITITRSIKGMDVSVSTSEFIIPFNFLPFHLIKLVDKLTAIFSKIPGLCYLGGSVEIMMVRPLKSS